MKKKEVVKKGVCDNCEEERVLITIRNGLNVCEECRDTYYQNFENNIRNWKMEKQQGEK